MIRNIFLDLDDTLLDFKAAERKAVAQTLEQIGVAVNEHVLTRYSVLNLSQWKRMERGEITVEQVKTNRYELLFEELGVAADAAQTTKIYEGFLAAQHPELPGARAMMDALYGKYRLYLASNGTARVQHQRLDESGFGRYFDKVFLSQELGANKPDPAFFEACFAQLDGFQKQESVIFGDSLTSDILGGLRAGIVTVWFNPGGKPAGGIKPDHEVRALDEFPPLIASLSHKNSSFF